MSVSQEDPTPQPQPAGAGLASGPPVRVESTFSVIEAIGHIVLWILLTLVTLGFALFIFPYYAQKLVVGRFYLVDRNGGRVGRLRCDLSLAQAIGHALLWALLTVVTFGVAYFVYIYKVADFTLKHTVIEPVP